MLFPPVSGLWLKEITESFRLEKTFKIMEIQPKKWKLYHSYISW